MKKGVLERTQNQFIIIDITTDECGEILHKRITFF